MPLQRQHAQHRGVTRGADRHRLARCELRRQRHQPFALQTRLLCQTAPMNLTHAPAVEHHAVADLVVGAFALLDRTDQIDAGDHRKPAHDRALAGNGKAVLVVEGGVAHTQPDIPFRQLRLVDLLERRPVACVVLLDQNAFEHNQPLLSCKNRPFVF